MARWPGKMRGQFAEWSAVRRAFPGPACYSNGNKIDGLIATPMWFWVDWEVI